MGLEKEKELKRKEKLAKKVLGGEIFTKLDLIHTDNIKNDKQDDHKITKSFSKPLDLQKQIELDNNLKSVDKEKKVRSNSSTCIIRSKNLLTIDDNTNNNK